GLQQSLQLASIVAVLAGWFVAWRSAANLPHTAGRGPRVRSWMSTVALAVIGCALIVPQWNHARLASGAYRLAPTVAAGDIETALEAGDFHYHRAGPAGTASVRP